ncbi:mitochondrial folate carrier protein [Phialemonium atrogriseum]|uniref:Mitochondrial folate carrier protein n=1 Tax=Phialemonium atrogriseum TaxID=1093897 RepID=A0AAJ0C603_9PEZI|nr:mitochondrial folate carrier protein [Phialemonium atrogriseum]KAK1770596.1 mitochondrial folate carrier protein [Phialemonium atrogriseum]
MTDVKHAGLSPALVETIAGLLAGSIATLTVHPLDIVKTRMQIHRSSTSPSATLSTLSLIRTLAQADRPLAALYRGLTPNLVGNASSWASFFFFKSRIERAIATLKGDGTPLTPADFFASSGLAGAATQAITNPIWVLKTRMLSSDRAAAGAYPSMWAGAARLMREEGAWGFYRGLGVGLLGVSHGAVQFAVYEPAKRMYLARRARRRAAAAAAASGDLDGGVRRGGRGGPIANEATIGLATLSKLVAGAVTYPLQVLRSRLQNYNAEERFGRGIRGVVRQLWREEGVRGFYRGLVPGVVRVLPATWVTFLVYENVKYHLPRLVD